MTQYCLLKFCISIIKNLQQYILKNLTNGCSIAVLIYQRIQAWTIESMDEGHVIVRGRTSIECSTSLTDHIEGD